MFPEPRLKYTSFKNNFLYASLFCSQQTWWVLMSCRLPRRSSLTPLLADQRCLAGGCLPSLGEDTRWAQTTTLSQVMTADEQSMKILVIFSSFVHDGMLRKSKIYKVGAISFQFAFYCKCLYLWTFEPSFLLLQWLIDCTCKHHLWHVVIFRF